MTYVLLTKAFWADTLERTVATTAQAVAATWGADVVFPNAFTLDYKVLAGVAAGGAIAALVKQLAKVGITAQVPAAPAPLKRSGGDVEFMATQEDPGTIANPTPDASADYQTAPVTNETMGLD